MISHFNSFFFNPAESWYVVALCRVFSSAFCIAVVFVNGALSRDPDTFARREKDGRNGAFTPLHLFARRKQLKSANAVAGNVLCVRLVEPNEENLNTFFYVHCFMIVTYRERFE